MTDSLEHLTEEERQTIADGTLRPERAHAVDLHLRDCHACAADVARLAMLMTRTRDTPSRSDDMGDLWPSIRARIEERQLAPVTPSGRDVAFTVWRSRRKLWGGAIGALAAAAVITIAVVRSRTTATTSEEQISGTSLPVIAAADSTHAYEEEARALLARLEVQRAVMRPESAQLLERDLRTIDAAIAELKAAIANDPNNPALRQLLASSYRQKVELLKRAGNAG